MYFLYASPDNLHSIVSTKLVLIHSGLLTHEWHSFIMVFSSCNQHLFDEFLLSFMLSTTSVTTVALSPVNTFEDVILKNINIVILK